MFCLNITEGEDAWIGFNDIQEEGLFNWADGRLVNYTHWGLGQPDSQIYFDKDCVLMQQQVFSSIDTYMYRADSVCYVHSCFIYRL